MRHSVEAPRHVGVSHVASTTLSKHTMKHTMKRPHTAPTSPDHHLTLSEEYEVENVLNHRRDGTDGGSTGKETINAAENALRSP
jgi:hypothetical protein